MLKPSAFSSPCETISIGTLTVLPGAALVETTRTTLAVVGGMIMKLSAFETPPPGAGFETVTLAVPAVAMSPAEIAAVNCVLLINVVGLSTPFHLTTEALTKSVPVTVRVKAAPPAVPEFGFKLASAGAGLLIVKLATLDVPPPGAGFETVTLAVPALAISPAGICAVNPVPLTNVV